ncbi:radial spoke head protein 9 homolog [Corticium candelabrum]|uniref:radial spoke head protein 9 homolog n=1 Tax=Corticium candelabrum TaxID=121492 RepID=UPI002E2561F8|nr:radial spoke head protein 9 homolog [Corticium candelabrum]
MDTDRLHLDLDYLGSSGVILSTEQKASLKNSLLLLKNREKFRRVELWGRIVGIQGEYFIAQGFGVEQLMEKKYHYSVDCRKWAQLPKLDDAARARALKVEGRFMGDAAYEAEYIEPPVNNSDPNASGQTVVVKEEERLVAVVEAISHDVAVVPRGTYAKDPDGIVIQNRSFRGLSLAAASNLSSYLHFRAAEELEKKTIIQKANLDKSIDFLDSIEHDIPKGCWSLQLEQGGQIAVLRSLWWIGYVSYHIPNTNSFGSFYTGFGQKNQDLPFML